MSNEEIKEGMENVSGGSGSEPKKYPEIIIRSVKYGGPRINRPALFYGGPALRPVKPGAIIKPIVTEKSKRPAEPFVPGAPENSEK